MVCVRSVISWGFECMVSAKVSTSSAWQSFKLWSCARGPQLHCIWSTGMFWFFQMQHNIISCLHELALNLPLLWSSGCSIGRTSMCKCTSCGHSKGGRSFGHQCHEVKSLFGVEQVRLLYVDSHKYLNEGWIFLLNSWNLGASTSNLNYVNLLCWLPDIVEYLRKHLGDKLRTLGERTPIKYTGFGSKQQSKLPYYKYDVDVYCSVLYCSVIKTWIQQLLVFWSGLNVIVVIVTDRLWWCWMKLRNDGDFRYLLADAAAEAVSSSKCCTWCACWRVTLFWYFSISSELRELPQFFNHTSMKIYYLILLYMSEFAVSVRPPRYSLFTAGSRTCTWPRPRCRGNILLFTSLHRFVYKGLTLLRTSQKTNLECSRSL